MSFPAGLSSLLYFGLRAVCDPGSVPGFHLEAPAQELLWVQVTPQPRSGALWPRVHGTGICWQRALLWGSVLWGFHHAGECSAQ